MRQAELYRAIRYGEHPDLPPSVHQVGATRPSRAQCVLD